MILSDPLRDAVPADVAPLHHLASAFEDAVIGMTLVAPDDTPLVVNNAFCDFLGYPRAQLQRLRQDDIVHPGDLEDQRRRRRLLLAGEQDTYRVEKRYIHRDGRILWADFSCKLVRDDEGRPLHFLSQVLDITQRKQAELALHEAQALMDMAGQIGQLGGWAYAVDAPSLTLSAQACAILGARPGYAPSPAEAMTWFGDEYRPLIRAALRECLLHGSPFDIEAPATTPRGRPIWLRIICEAEWDEGARVRRLHGAMQDITPAKQTQLALQESERQLAALMSNLPGMAYRCLNAPQWPLVFASQGAVALTGFTPEQLIESAPGYAALIHPDDRDRVWQRVQQALAAKEQFQFTYRIRTRAGDEKWVWEQGCGVFDAEGGLRWLEGFISDVTQSKLAQLEVARLNESLEGRVQQRTRQMQQANEELEALAYSIAHDLRGPMTSLHGFSKLLAQDLKDLEPRTAHYLARIMGNVSHMSELTDALLSLARLSGVQPVAERVDLAVLARLALRQLQEAQPGCAVVADIPATLPAVGDPGLLQRVMSNLVGNAWKFSQPKGEVHIRMGVETLPGGEQAWFVQDRGVGFDMAHAGNLFGAFRRLHTEGFDGTGIGLALVRKIIARHGGRVWAHAQPGAGATFHFTLPGPTA